MATKLDTIPRDNRPALILGLLSLNGSSRGRCRYPDPSAETNQFGGRLAAPDRQDPNAARQSKSPGTGGSRIKQHGAAVPAKRGAVAMAKYADIRLFAIQPGRRLGSHLPLFIQHMAECDSQAAPSEDTSPWKSTGFIPVHITGHRRDRRKLPQSANHVLFTDIAGMENFIDRGKMPLDGRIVDSVRVCDHADPDCRALGQRLAAPADV